MDNTLAAALIGFIFVINYVYFLYEDRYVEIISYFEIQEKRKKVGSTLTKVWLCFTAISTAFFLQGMYKIF